MISKYDGHTHTEYCPHGAVKDTEQLIQRAITLGFKEYSITEHAPLPKDIFSKAGGEREIWTTASMSLADVDSYFKRMQQLKERYASDILIHIGFELDYFADFEDWTRDFLNEYGPLTDDSVLSVHFLPGIDGLRAVDFSYEEYRDGVVAAHGSFQKAQLSYYQTVIQSLQADLGPYKPKRLGHISLCQKYEQDFAETTDYSTDSLAAVDQLLQLVKAQGYQLDLNTAGFDKSAYQQSYPQDWLIQKACTLDIPLVFGSDSHQLSDVGRHFDQIQHY